MSKIYCHNVRIWTRDIKKDDWYWKDRMKRIRDIIVDNRPDILCLQELSFPANTYIPKGYRRVGFSASHPIYVHKGIKTRRHRFHFRWESCEVKIGNEWTLIVNVHLHWDDIIFARNMADINKCIYPYVSVGRPVLLCGDWNKSGDTVWRYFTSAVWQVPNNQPTYKNKITGGVGIIDHFFSNYPYATTLYVLQSELPLSDHNPLLLSI